MSTNSELAVWGEPPATEAEELLAGFLETALEKLERCEAVQTKLLLQDSPERAADAETLIQDAMLLYQAVTSVWAYSGLLEETLTKPIEWERTMRADNPVVGDTLPNPFPSEFHVLTKLGEGAFGEVWLADDVNLGRQVALKTLRFRDRTDAGSRALEALRKEARTLAKVRHPNIVQVYAWLQAKDDPYLVLQYVAGGSLDKRIDREGIEKEGPLSWQDAARYIADVGEGLLAVHACGILHRDIKPANILWDPQKDEALLTDFGVSGRLADSRTLAGTPLYMAPEAIDSEPTSASDVYSLAVTLFHLLTGTQPFRGKDLNDQKQLIKRGLPDDDPRCRVIPEPLEQIVRSGLAAAPEQRPPLKDFVSTLRGSLNQLLADALLTQRPLQQQPAHVDLRMLVSRLDADGNYKRLTTTHETSGRLTRDMKKVPPQPEHVRLRTGDRVRIDVTTKRTGFVTVFNIGPTGNLNMLYPDELSNEVIPPSVRANEPLCVLDVELTPPAGRERLFAIWSQMPLPLQSRHLLSLAELDEHAFSGPYRATRDMKRVKESVQRLPTEDRQVVVLELNHGV